MTATVSVTHRFFEVLAMFGAEAADLAAGADPGLELGALDDDGVHRIPDRLALFLAVRRGAPWQQEGDQQHATQGNTFHPDLPAAAGEMRFCVLHYSGDEGMASADRLRRVSAACLHQWPAFCYAAQEAGRAGE